MKIFKKVWSFVWNPKFYQNLDGVPIWPGIKRLATFIFIASFIFSVWIAIGTVPEILDMSQKLEKYIYTNYPEDLVLTIENGKASTSEDKRYELKADKFFEYFNSEFNDEDAKSIGIENMIVIDTRETDWKFEDWKNAKAGILITKDSIVSVDRGSYKVDSLSKFKEKFVLDRGSAISYSSKILQVLRIALPFLGVLMFVVFFLTNVIIYLISGLIIALIIYLGSKLGKTKKNFKTAFEITLYAMCLPVFIVIVFAKLFEFPFIFVALAVLLIWLFNSRVDTDTDLIVKE